MSDGLAAFFAARLDEDETSLHELTEIGERKRDAATEADFAANMPAMRELLADPAVMQIMQRQVALGYSPPNDVSHVLREIAAKRAILTRYEFAWRQAEVNIGAEQEAWEKIAGALERDVIDLAAVYSGHADYRDEWAVSTANCDKRQE